MRIDRVSVYRVNGKDFDTLAKARDYVDGLVNEVLTRSLVAKGFTVSECIKITDAVLSQASALADLLDVSLPGEDD